jgi:multidrug efflux pump subunit AcrA (membrane-fusion protein)
MLLFVNRRTRFGCLFLTLLLGLLSGCRFGNRPPPTPAPLAPVITNVEQYTVQRGDIVVSVEFPGTVNLRRQTELFFAQEGRAATIHVQSGDFVRAGAVLAELEIDELQIQLTEAEWDLEIVREKHAVAAEEHTFALQLARQEIKVAELTLASLLAKELDKPGSVPAEEIAKAEGALTAAQLALKRLDRTDELVQQKELITAETTIQRLQKQIDQSRLVAPFDGNVYFMLPLEDLQRLPAKAYEPVMRLVDPTSLTVEASLPESDLAGLAETMPVSVSLTYRPGVVLPGVIQYLPFPFGAGGGPFVEIAVPVGEQQKLRVGGAVQIYAEVQRREAVLWLPPQALRTIGNQVYAAVRRGESTPDVLVQVGAQSPDRVEIISGLAENEIVVRK